MQDTDRLTGELNHYEGNETMRRIESFARLIFFRAIHGDHAYVEKNTYHNNHVGLIYEYHPTALSTAPGLAAINDHLKINHTNHLFFSATATTSDDDSGAFTIKVYDRDTMNELFQMSVMDSFSMWLLGFTFHDGN